MISLFSLLDSDQIDIILNTLEMIQSAIGFGIQEVSKSNLNVNPIVELLCKNNIHKKIEGLEKNQNKEIEELASYIYEKYLDVE